MSTAVTEPEVTDVPVNAGGFPLNRIVAFFGPQIAILAGFVATWLVEHLEFLHLDATGTKGLIINAITFVLTAILTWAGQHKWLDGWQKWEQKVAPAVVAALPDSEDIPTDEELRALGGFDGDPVHPDDIPTAGLPDSTSTTINVSNAADDIYGVEPEGDVSKFGEGADVEGQP